MVRRLTHLGICVSDLAVSLRFYCGALGFVEVGRFRDAHGLSSKLLELEEVRMTAVYIERDDWRIELLHYDKPGSIGPATRRPMNQVGLTHLSFVVEDLEQTARRIVESGGELIESTRTGGRSAAIFATDPDGTRLELVERDGDPMAIPGQKPRRA